MADEVEPEDLRQLLYYLIDTVLERARPVEPEVTSLTRPSLTVPSPPRTFDDLTSSRIASRGRGTSNVVPPGAPEPSHPAAPEDSRHAERRPCTWPRWSDCSTPIRPHWGNWSKCPLTNAAGLSPVAVRCEEHMTVTVEEFHHSPVDVVLAKKTVLPHYARKILLSRQTDGRVVQFGIVRLNFSYLAPEVQWRSKTAVRRSAGY